MPFARPSRTARTLSISAPHASTRGTKARNSASTSSGEACRIAHERGRRIYLTLNVLIKPDELIDALMFLGERVDLGIDAVIVQDIGLIRLIRKLYPALEIHGSTQMTVHDSAGAAVCSSLGVQRVVLARENTLDDIREIRAAVPDLGLETFVHGALCISYSGQCFMSGMISERSANRGSCAQSCRKDYVLTDAATGDELDRGYLISAKDLGAYEHLPAIAEAGIVCLKVEGRKKKPEYVATVTKTYRDLLDRVERGEDAAAASRKSQPPRPDLQPRIHRRDVRRPCRVATMSRARSRTIAAPCSVPSSDTSGAS